MAKLHSMDRMSIDWDEHPHRLGAIGAVCLGDEPVPRTDPVFAIANPTKGRHPAVDADRFERMRATWLEQNLDRMVTPNRGAVLASPGEYRDASTLTAHGRTWQRPDGLSRLRLPPIVVSSHGYRFIQPIGGRKRPIEAPMQHRVQIPWDAVRADGRAMVSEWERRIGECGPWLRGFFVRCMAWKKSCGVTKEAKQWRRQGTHLGRFAGMVEHIDADRDGIELELWAGVRGKQAAAGDAGQQWAGHDSYSLVLLFDLVLPQEGRATRHVARMQSDKTDGDSGLVTADLGLPAKRMSLWSGFDLDVIARAPKGSTRAHEAWANATVGRLIRGVDMGISKGQGVVRFSNRGPVDYPHVVRARMTATAVGEAEPVTRWTSSEEVDKADRHAGGADINDNFASWGVRPVVG